MSRHSLFISLFSSSRFLSMAASGSSPILRRAQVQRPPLLFFASNPESLLWPPPASSSSWPHSWSSPLPPKSPTGEVEASSSLATRARLGLLVAIVEGSASAFGGADGRGGGVLVTRHDVGSIVLEKIQVQHVYTDREGRATRTRTRTVTPHLGHESNPTNQPRRGRGWGGIIK